MFPEISGGPLNIIASAVTPAVMISASAILIGGVSSKHSSMADRVRTLTTEYRNPQTLPERRDNIEKQCRLFARRLRLISLSHMMLYIATALFLLMVLAISVSPVAAGSQRILFPLFLAGIAVLLISAVLEVIELRIGNYVLLLEMADAMVHREK